MEENNVSKFEKKEVEIESKLYRLEEMYDAMQASLENAKKVKNEQEMLIEIVKKSKKHNLFKDFIESEEKQTKELEQQIPILENRAQLLKNAIETCKGNEEIEKAMTVLLEALGVFSE